MTKLHVLRTKEEKSAEIVTYLYPRNGERGRGGQLRWEYEFKQTAGPNWRRFTRDRGQWKWFGGGPRQEESGGKGMCREALYQCITSLAGDSERQSFMRCTAEAKLREQIVY
ncbi:hypothetical protein EVAR_93396_1 [Eumeta japonica]|uniref:Uncharacterized protein n=1 Tax=Eumeta variegata TaxID=151549 RepID=A0A4C1UQ48_EUMVA|nr:hypothetical protein EVAR_93396_1 [Eumeta japonica]